MSKKQWKYKKFLRKKCGTEVWVLQNRRGIEGYFKFLVAQKRTQRIMVANEYIGAALAKLVGLPTAKVKKISATGRKGQKRAGLVSVSANAQEVITWREANDKIHDHPEKYLEQSHLLPQIIVFDAWILNPDRTNRNIILYRNTPQERYKWYLIDHGAALFGTPAQWKLKRAKMVYGNKSKITLAMHSRKKDVLKVPKGLKYFSYAHIQEMQEMVRKIQAISPVAISKSLKKVPKRYLKRSEKTYMKKILLSRQRQIQQIYDVVLKRIRPKGFHLFLRR